MKVVVQHLCLTFPSLSSHKPAPVSAAQKSTAVLLQAPHAENVWSFSSNEPKHIPLNYIETTLTGLLEELLSNAV